MDKFTLPLNLESKVLCSVVWQPFICHRTGLTLRGLTRDIPTMIEPFPHVAAWFPEMNTPQPRNRLWKGLDEAAVVGFKIRNYKVNEKLIYFNCLSVITKIACLPSAMIANMAFISVGGPP